MESGVRARAACLSYIHCREDERCLTFAFCQNEPSKPNPIRPVELAPVSWTVDRLALGYVVRGHFVLLCGHILLFGPRRSHSSVPARTCAPPARGAAVKDGHLWPPEGLVLDGREHDGILWRAGIGRLLVLEAHRREISDRGMAPSAIVEAFDEGEHCRARL